MPNTDKSYTPLRCDFDQVMSTYFAGQQVTPEQHKVLEMIFFAGAASAYAVVVNTPEQRETLFEELADHVEHQERQKVQ